MPWNRVNDKDVDQFESYIYSLYYKVAEGKLSMADFSNQLTEYMVQNNISQDKFLKMQTKLMERYGIDTTGFEEQLKSLGLNNISTDPKDYEKVRDELLVKEDVIKQNNICINSFIKATAKEIDINEDIINLLNTSNKIGLTITKDKIMIPRKSVVAIIGISENKSTYKQKSCLECSNYNTCKYKKGDDNYGCKGIHKK